MKSCSEEDLLEVAIQAARQAGLHALENRDRRNEVACRYAHDLKLQLDRECQEIAEAIILERYPSHHILGEERQDDARADATRWIIDPIDGTVNFQHGLTLWCSSVAVQIDGEVVAGAVYAPDMKELFTATRKGPAFCNGTPIRVSQTDKLADSILLTGVSKHIDQRSDIVSQVRELALRTQKIRVMGAAAVDLCQVAAGRADGYYESSIYLWDIAAAGLIARRAGAVTETLEELAPLQYRFMCTNGRIHEELKALVRAYAP